MSERLILSWMMQDRDGWQAGRLWQPAMSHRVSHTKVDALLTWLPALPPFSADLKAQGSSPQGMGRTGMACADNMLGRRG